MKAMFGNIGPLEIAIVLIIALIVFGPKRLPELGSSLGKGIREFKETISSDRPDDEDEEIDDEVKALTASTATADPAAPAEPDSAAPVESEPAASDKRG